MDSGRTVDHGPCDLRGSFSLDLPPPFDAFFVSCANAVLEKAGREGVAGVFLGGSLALGEGGIDTTSGKPELIGDVDLLAVVSSLRAHERLYSMRRELGSACEAISEGIEFKGRVDVGVMLPADLESMGPSPFVYDLKNHGVMLYGSADLLERIPGYAEGEIGGPEVTKLLENRIASLLGSYEMAERDEGADRRLFLYEISKVYTDICTAVLCMSGLYVSGYAARCKRLREARIEGELVLPVPEDLFDDIESWTRFKLSPSSRGGGDGAGSPPPIELWDASAGLALDWWMLCEGLLQDRGRGREMVSSAEILLRRRIRAVRGGNLRAWMRMTDRWPVSRKIELAAGLRKAVFSIDPLGYVREWGIRLLDIYAGGRKEERVARPAARYPHDGGSWEKAVRGTIGAWREIVYGAKDR
jgi:hypothetical protein